MDISSDYIDMEVWFLKDLVYENNYNLMRLGDIKRRVRHTYGRTDRRTDNEVIL